jgi:hypothetical protein
MSAQRLPRSHCYLHVVAIRQLFNNDTSVYNYWFIHNKKTNKQNNYKQVTLSSELLFVICALAAFKSTYRNTRIYKKYPPCSYNMIKLSKQKNT